MTEARRRVLERIVGAFVTGYHAALEEGQPERLAVRLHSCDPDLRGFAFEGAGMGLWLLDSLVPGRRDRWARFCAHAPQHEYLIHVGAGWALARLGQRFEARTAGLDPLLRWLVLDGCGFHHGYFHPERYHGRGLRPALQAEAARVFDQGLGRSLWFVAGAEPARISASLARFPSERRQDLWSGVGLACAYAGGVSLAEVERLLHDAGDAASHFAQGVAFAVAARCAAGNPTEHSDAVCRLVFSRSPGSVAASVDRVRRVAEEQGDYAVWRSGTRAEVALRAEVQGANP